MKEQERESRLVGFGKFFVGVLISAISATGTTAWIARGAFADFDHRITIVETRQQITDENVKTLLTSIQSDVRDLRQAQLQSADRGKP